MSLTHRHVLAVTITVGIVTLSTIAVRMSSAAVEPVAVKAASEALALPSIPQPLPGSGRSGGHGWTIAEACSKVIADYQQPGAPIPAGATITPGAGRLTFVNRYGPSAVIATFDAQGIVTGGKPVDEPPTCHYLVLASPNVTIEAAGDLTAVSAFGNVGCGVDSDDAPYFLAAYDAADGVQIMAMGDFDDGPAVVFVSAATMASVGPDAAMNDPSTQRYPYSGASREDDVLTINVETPGGSAHVSVLCTGSIQSVPELNQLVTA